MLSSIRHFHVQHGYYVLTEKLENGMRLVLPKNVLTSSIGESVVLNYELTPADNGYVKISKSLENCPALLPVELLVPSYAVRVVVVADITITCITHNFNAELLASFDDNGNLLENTQIYELLKEPIDIEHLEKEEAFIKVFEGFSSGRDVHSLARITGVEEGYLLLLDIFREGGM